MHLNIVYTYIQSYILCEGRNMFQKNNTGKIPPAVRIVILIPIVFNIIRNLKLPLWVVRKI